MTATPLRSIVVTVAVLGVTAVLVWAAASGPVAMVSPSAFAERSAEGPTVVRPTDPPDTDQSSDRPGESLDSGELATWVTDIASIAVLLAGLWVLSLLVRLVVTRLPGRQLVLDLEPLPAADVGREAVQQREHRLRESLQGSDLRNGIVACWVLLEEAAAQSGVERRPADTATELVVRFLHALDVNPRPVARLAGLYHEARFSTHTLTAGDRSRAEDALSTILADLDRAGAR